MNNDKLKLLDGSEIEAISMYSLDSIVVLLEDVDGLQELKDKLTDDNLSAIEIYNGAGNKIGVYENLRLNDIWRIRWTDEGIEATFGLKQKTDEELRIEALESNMQVSDGAVDALASTVGSLARQIAAGNNETTDGGE